MSDLHNKNCIPCKGGIPPFDISEIHKYLKKVDGWDVNKNKDEVFFLEKKVDDIFQKKSKSHFFQKIHFFGKPTSLKKVTF